MRTRSWLCDGHLSEAERSRVAVHLDSCEACFALVGAAVRGESGSEEQSGRIAKPLLSKGAEIGRYLILDIVGKGGMGEVYSAYDPKLDRRVALKLLNERTASPRATARFSREAQAIARLSHPNVIAIYDAGDFGERLYLTMEFVEGQRWRTGCVLRRGRGARFATCSSRAVPAWRRPTTPASCTGTSSHRTSWWAPTAGTVMDFGLATDNSEIDSDDAASFDPTGAGPNRRPGPSR